MRTTSLWITAATILLILSGCAGTPPHPMETAFQAAIKDARAAPEMNITHRLVPIRPDNPSLVWKEGLVRVATLIDTEKYFQCYAPAKNPVACNNHGVWVTAVPQFRNFCKRTGLSGEALTLRMKQWLGLQPGDGSPMMIAELWVDPKNLWRPCPDPEIDDATCNPTMADNVDQEYRKWFIGTMAHIYGSTPGQYPWTRLGYTYDWKYPPPQPAGASEFLIKPDSAFTVFAIRPLDGYCRTAGKFEISRHKGLSNPVDGQKSMAVGGTHRTLFGTDPIQLFFNSCDVANPPDWCDEGIM